MNDQKQPMSNSKILVVERACVALEFINENFKENKIDSKIIETFFENLETCENNQDLNYLINQFLENEKQLSIKVDQLKTYDEKAFLSSYKALKHCLTILKEILFEKNLEFLFSILNDETLTWEDAVKLSKSESLKICQIKLLENYKIITEKLINLENAGEIYEILLNESNIKDFFLGIDILVDLVIFAFVNSNIDQKTLEFIFLIYTIIDFGMELNENMTLYEV